MRVADIILEQLGGGRFLAMTGANHLVSDGNTLRMQLPRNASKANRLWITLRGDDTYDMRFFRQTGGTLSKKTWEFSPIKETEVALKEMIYCDQLQEIFTSVTGMYTHL